MLLLRPWPLHNAKYVFAASSQQYVPLSSIQSQAVTEGASLVLQARSPKSQFNSIFLLPALRYKHLANCLFKTRRTKSSRNWLPWELHSTSCFAYSHCRDPNSASRGRFESLGLSGRYLEAGRVCEDRIRSPEWPAELVKLGILMANRSMDESRIQPWMLSIIKHICSLHKSSTSSKPLKPTSRRGWQLGCLKTKDIAD